MTQFKGPILYFIDGTVPTNAEFEKASKVMGKGPIVSFVSLASLDLNDALLQGSAVGGKVPEAYKDYPQLEVETKKSAK